MGNAINILTGESFGSTLSSQDKLQAMIEAGVAPSICLDVEKKYYSNLTKKLKENQALFSIGNSATLPLDGSANASVRHGLGARLAANFSQGEDKEEEMYKELFCGKAQNSVINGFVDNTVTSIGIGSLVGWTNLKGNVYFNECTTVNSGWGQREPPFGGCTFDELHLPKATVIGSQWLAYASIKRIYVDALTSIPSNFGRSLSYIEDVYLRGISLNQGITSLNSTDYFVAVSTSVKQGMTIHFDGGNAIFNGSSWVEQTAQKR